MRTPWILVAACVGGVLGGCGKSRESRDETQASAPATAAVATSTPDTATPSAPGTEPATPSKDTPASPPTAEGASGIPLYFDRPVSAAELRSRSLRELSLMRNTIFARAGNKFRKEWLHAYFAAQPWYQERERMDESVLSELDWQNAQIIAEVERSFSEAELEAREAELLAAIGAAEPTPSQRVELEMLSRRLGRWAGPDQVAQEDVSPLEDPTKLDQVLGLGQLEDMSLKDLRILRNTIYARRGYVFKSDLLTQYFDLMEWYQPDPGYTDARLTAVDWKNIKLIKSVEIQNGGPLRDMVHEEMGWFDGA